MLVIGGCHETSVDLPNQQDGYCWKLMKLLGIESLALSSSDNGKVLTNMERLKFLQINMKTYRNRLILLAIRKENDFSSEEMNMFFQNIMDMEKLNIKYIIIDTAFVNKDNFELINKFTKKQCLSGFAMIEPNYMNIYHFCKFKGFSHNNLYHYGPKAHIAFANYVYDNYMEWKMKNK